MKPIEEIRNAPRVQCFRPWEKEPDAYTFTYTFSDKSRVCSVIIGLNEEGNNGKYHEHASISIYGGRNRLPTWEQMVEIKDLIWQDEEECYQVFPKKSEYIHGYKDLKNVMHIWRDKV